MIYFGTGDYDEAEFLILLGVFLLSMLVSVIVYFHFKK